MAQLTGGQPDGALEVPGALRVPVGPFEADVPDGAGELFAPVVGVPAPAGCVGVLDGPVCCGEPVVVVAGDVVVVLGVLVAVDAGGGEALVPLGGAWGVVITAAATAWVARCRR